jgi:type II secretory pathway pseudopilin PulG
MLPDAGVRKQRGYTLIDLAMALTIFGLLLAGVSSGLRVYMKDKQLTDTREHSQMVVRALENYILQEGRFPCPAPVNASLEDAAYGVALGACATADVGAPGSFAGGIWVEEAVEDPANRVVRGMVPFATLGLPEFFVYDGYGNRLQYAVSSAKTDRESFANSRAGIMVLGDHSDEDDMKTRLNHFVVFSSGADERGAWSRYGREVLPCDTAALDGENCNTASDARAAYRLARHSTVRPGDAAYGRHFDDIVQNVVSIHLPQWRTDENDKESIQTVDANQKLFITATAGQAVPAAPAGAAAAQLRIDVMGEAKAAKSMAANYCLYDDADKCFAPEILMDSGNNALNCDAQMMKGIGLSVAECVSGYSVTCGAGEFIAGINPDGSAKCQAYNFSTGEPPAVQVPGCGASNYKALKTAPASGTLCAAGTPSTATASAEGWTWTCASTNSDLVAGCKAFRDEPAVDGVCGSSHGGTYVSAPGSNLCAAGTASTVNSGSSAFTWTCAGQNGGATASCSATRVYPIPGACGSANNANLAAAPSGGSLCSQGTATAVSGSGPWAWSCSGQYGGASANCSANRTINGTCGTAHNANYASAPTTNLCGVGTASAVTGAGPWAWTCAGQYGGTTASCTANKSQPGACGTANGASYASKPTTNLCAAGTASTVSGAGPWTWTCAGVGGGAASGTCTAYKTGTPTPPKCTLPMTTSVCVNGSCQNNYGMQTPPPAGPYMKQFEMVSGAGLPSLTVEFKNTSGSTSIPNWSCTATQSALNVPKVCDTDYPVNLSDRTGTVNMYAYITRYNTSDYMIQYMVASAECEYKAGTCGASNGGSFATPPTSGLCSSGVAGSVGQSGSKWGWYCGSTYCQADKVDPVDGYCGSSSAQAMYSKPTTNLCASGTATAVTGSGPWNWSCTGSGGGQTSGCQALLRADGACGTANGGTFSSQPSSNLCSSGTAVGMSGSGPWTWHCNGTNGGNTPSCSANKAAAPTNGACGASNGGTFSSAPSSGLCSTGSATSVSGSGPWTWSCNGANGGTNAGCSANKTAPTNVGDDCGEGDLYAGVFNGKKLCITAPAYQTILTWSAVTTDLSSLTNCTLSGTFKDQPDNARGCIDGEHNTQVISALAASYPAVDYCADLTAHGHSDWYLPAFKELKHIHYTMPGSAYRYSGVADDFYWSSSEGSEGGQYAIGRFNNPGWSHTDRLNVRQGGNTFRYMNHIVMCVREYKE